MKFLIVCLIGSLLAPVAFAKEDRIDIHFNLKQIETNEAEVDSSTPPTYSLQVVKALAPGYAATPHLIEPQFNGQLVVAALNEAGQEIERQVILDPTFTVAEEFAEDGTISGELVYLDNAPLFLSLPSNTATIVLYRPVFTETSYNLETIDNAELDNLQLRMSATAQVMPPPQYEVETVVDNGDPARLYDIVMVGDGYTADELDDFADHVQEFVDFYKTKAPFDAYADLFNIHKINVISNESGMDRPDLDPPVFVDTVLDSGRTESSNGLRSDAHKLKTIVAEHLPVEARDALFVIINSDHGRANAYGNTTRLVGKGNKTRNGTTGEISYLTNMEHVALHEFAHILGLGDEYHTFCRSKESQLTGTPNLTTLTDREQVKWNYWINPLTPVPTAYEDLDTLVDLGVTSFLDRSIEPVVYPISTKCDPVLRRPAYQSAMKSTTARFGPVNEEALIKSLFNHVSLFTDPVPSDNIPSVILNKSQNETQRFSITPSKFVNSEIQWYLDDQRAGTGTSLSLDSNDFKTHGVFNLKAVAKHSTEKVQRDPNNNLQRAEDWTLFVDECSAAPSPPTELKTEFTSDRTMKLTWKALKEAGYYELKVGDESGDWTSIKTQQPESVIDGLAPDTTYFASVQAMNSCGVSQASPQITAKTRQPCAGNASFVQNIEVIDLGDSYVSLKWDAAPHGNQYEFQIFKTGVPFSSWVSRQTTIDNKIMLTELPPDTDLDISVGAVAAEQECSTGVKKISITTKKACSIKPPIPLSANSSNITETSFELTWLAANEALYYDLYWYQNGVYMGRETTENLAYNYSGAAAGTDQEVRIVAVNSCGRSEPAIVKFKTKVNSADLALTFTALNDGKPSNGVLSFRMNINNNGPDSAELVKLNITVPQGVTINKHTTSTGTCNTLNRQLTCQMGAMASGSNQNVQVDVTANSNVDLSSALIASVSSSTQDPDISNNNIEKTATSGCFIATAAYGHIDHQYVKILRDFRDQYLLNNSAGREFVGAYYKYSPPIADWIAEREPVKAIIRLFLIPLIFFAWFIQLPATFHMGIALALVGFYAMRKQRFTLA